MSEKEQISACVLSLYIYLIVSTSLAIPWWFSLVSLVRVNGFCSLFIH